MALSKLKPLFDYIVRIGDALSQLANVVIFFSDNPNESISGKAYRLRRISTLWYFLQIAINYAFLWQDNHCRAAYRADIERASKTLRQQ
jgi:hypothetical protein